MSVHVHVLAGTAPTPLAHYLKALGVHRLVAEQADSGARGFWKGDVYRLVTVLDRAALEAFFLERYAPTPLVAPWNGGSGFYPKDNTTGFGPLSESTVPRFAPYAGILRSAIALVAGRDERPSGADKAALLHGCRAQWTGAAGAWLDAAVALTGDDPRYPSLLGTGGNDGRLDYTNNFMQRLVGLFDAETGAARLMAPKLLREALWRAGGGDLDTGAIGMFAPGAAGGANASTGSVGGALANPWDFVLMLEGAVAFQVAVVRRLEGGGGLPQAAAPFAVRAQAGGYASADASDESPRGEQWMPLWERPAAWDEVRGLLREGRLRLGRQPATKALDVARAIGRLGLSRGVTGFQRFGFVERNGKSYFAVPLGRWAVGEAPRDDVRLLDDLDQWFERLRRDAPSGELERVARRLGDAMLAVCQREAEGERIASERWLGLLALLGEAEGALVSRPKATAAAGLRPLPPLRAGWLGQLDFGRVEVRLAVAIASQYTPGSDGKRSSAKLGTIRANCAPIDESKASAVFRTEQGGAALAHDPSVVWTGRDLVADLGALVERRLVDARREGVTQFPLVSRFGVTGGDLEQFVFGRVDDGLIAQVARALMAVSWRDPGVTPYVRRHRRACDPGQASPLVALFKLLYAPYPLWFGKGAELAPTLAELRGREVPQDPRPLRLLRTHRLTEAVAAAAHRLRASGIATKFGAGGGDARTAERLAAAVAIPVRPRDMGVFYRLVVKPGAPAPAEVEGAESSDSL